MIVIAGSWRSSRRPRKAIFDGEAQCARHSRGELKTEIQKSKMGR
jgi:hypothetical protein